MKTKAFSIAVTSLFISLMLLTSVPLAHGVSASLTLYPMSGPPGTIVTIYGSGFSPGALRIYFDISNNVGFDSGEPYMDVIASTSGSFITTLTLPSVAVGIYYVRAFSLSSYTTLASAGFMVTKTIWEKLLDNQYAIDSANSKLDTILVRLGTAPGGSTGTIWGDIDRIYNYLKGTIKSELDAIKAKTDTINWADITDIKTKVDSMNTRQIITGGGHLIINDTGYYTIYFPSTLQRGRSYKITITLMTSYLAAYPEDLSLYYWVGSGTDTFPNYENVAYQYMRLYPAKTYEYCVNGGSYVWFYADSYPTYPFEVWYNYVVEYES